jgi:hypothetical protein
MPKSLIIIPNQLLDCSGYRVYCFVGYCFYVIDSESICIPAHQRAKSNYSGFSTHTVYNTSTPITINDVVVVVPFTVRASLVLGGTSIPHFDKIDDPYDVVDRL